ncbi:MAG: hypothetical protein FJX77_16110, partial [Armatimonadetes bacterium]|nr:hypothetical protein [Armatimonadota bacterium]
GRPLLSRGFLEEARRQAERLLIPLVRASASGTPIVFLEPSCQSMVRDDYLTLLPREHREAVADVARACVSLEEWAAGSPVLFPPPALEPSRFTPAAQPVLVHPHCHQPCMGNQEATLRALRGLPGTPITPLETGCCGMAGAFGYEHAPVSRQIAAHRLLPALAKADPEAVVAAPGFSCRSQIRELSGRAARHPAQILRDNLILSPAEYRRLRMEDDSAAG